MWSRLLGMLPIDIIVVSCAFVFPQSAERREEQFDRELRRLRQRMLRSTLEDHLKYRETTAKLSSDKVCIVLT